jgi:hypothetical protein
MTREDLLARITIDPAVCHGKPCIRGLRIWVGLVFGMLEAGIYDPLFLGQDVIDQVGRGVPAAARRRVLAAASPPAPGAGDGAVPSLP